MVSFIKRKIHNLVSDQKFSEILRGSVWALGARVLATIFTVLGTSTSILRLIPEHLAGYFPALALRGKNIGPEFGLSLHFASGAECELRTAV